MNATEQHHNAALVVDWRARAERLEEYAAACRQEGVIHGPEGAEDAERAALDYRREADALEAEMAAGVVAGGALEPVPCEDCGRAIAPHLTRCYPCMDVALDRAED